MVRLGPWIPLYAITKEKGLVYRVPECLSSELASSYTPFPPSECVHAPPLTSWGGTHFLAAEGVGGANSRRPNRNSGALCTLWAQLLYLNWFNFNDNRDCIQRDPMPELTLASPYVHSSVDSSTCTVPRATLCQCRLYPPSQGLWIWPQQSVPRIYEEWNTHKGNIEKKPPPPLPPLTTAMQQEQLSQWTSAI